MANSGFVREELTGGSRFNVAFLALEKANASVSSNQTDSANLLIKILYNLIDIREYSGDEDRQDMVIQELNRVLANEGFLVETLEPYTQPMVYELETMQTVLPVAGNESEEVGESIPTIYPTDGQTRVFIGHGRSPVWRELKDFLHDKLGLEWEEFNRVSVAGMGTTERLVELLDSCSFAFLIMTAEDETAGGDMNARQNVVHEAGLFQGRLGFRKAIVLLEKGCNEFGNIRGLGQIRFPKGNISAAFEEIRDVLEREELIPKS